MEGTQNSQEGEALNLENQEEVADVTEETPEEKLYTEEEVKKLRREYEEWIVSLKNKASFSEKAYIEVWNIASNPERLVEILDEDPKLWNKILKDYFNWQTPEEYKESIGYQEDFTDPKKIEAMIKKQAQELARQEKLEGEKTSFIEKLEMSDDEKTAFEEQLSELMQLKSFKAEDMTKVMEKAYRISVNEDGTQKKLKNAEVMAKSMATAKGGKTTTWKSDGKTDFDKDYDAFLRKNKLI